MATLTFSAADHADIPVLVLGLPAGHGLRLVELLDKRGVLELDAPSPADATPRAPLTTRRAVYAWLCEALPALAGPSDASPEALTVCQMLDFCAGTAVSEVRTPRDPEGASLWPALNAALCGRAFFAGPQGEPSVADWALFSVLHLRIRAMTRTQRVRAPEVVRWAAHVLEILREKARRDREALSLDGALLVAANAFVDATPMDLASLRAALAEVSGGAKESDASKSAKGAKSEKNQKAEKSVKEPSVDRTALHPLARVDLRVGRIVSVEKHPNADRLYVEQVDVGDAQTRQIVSGLYPDVPIEEMRGRLAVFVCNLKPATLCKTLSAGMILVAVADAPEGAAEDAPRLLEPVLLPEGVRPGDRVCIAGVEPQPDDVIKPKDTTWSDVKAKLSVVDGVAVYDGAHPLVIHGRSDIADARLFSKKVAKGILS